MIVVALHDTATGQISLAMEPPDPVAALQILEASAASIRQQLAAPKLIMPNGQAKPVMPEQGSPGQPPPGIGLEGP